MIPRANETGLQLLIDFLLWNAEKRPTAQQALKYPFFHITKLGSDLIQLPTSLLTKHQQQQQIQQIRNQNIANDRMSHISLDDGSERYSSNDGNYMTRHYSHLNGHTHYQQKHQQSNNTHQINDVKQATANDDAKHDDYLTDEAEDSMKRTKFKNGINSNLTNGELKHYASSMNNNNYQSEISADDANSEVSMQPQNTFASAMSETPFSLTIQKRHQQPNGHINYNNNHDNNNKIAASNGTKGLIRNNHRKDQASSIGGFNSRRNSRINDENSAFFNEKISDIFVNRNPAKLYNSNNNNNNDYNAPGSIFNNKLYNGMEPVSQNSATRSQDFGYKNKGFFLHDNNTAMMNGESKLYNIFSKQRQTNGMMKMPNVQAKKLSVHRKSVTNTMHEQDSFEDEQLDKLLG